MIDAFCPPHPDVLLVGIGTALVAGVFAILNMSWVNAAEGHVDEKHWAGVPKGYGLISFLYSCLRANTGLGYTPEGRSMWWLGFRWVLLAAVLLFALGLAVSGSAFLCE